MPRLAVAGIVSIVSLLAGCGDEPTGASSAPASSSATGGAATGGGGAGSGGSDGGAGGTGGSAPSGVAMFVAHGHMARTTISCDGGHSWVADQSNDDSAICWEPPDNLPDCDHDPGAGRGIAYGGGWFVATYGWGPPGGLRRSADGVSWEEVVTGTTFGGVAYNPNSGAFVAAGSTPRRSLDAGATWTELGPAGISSNVRRFGFADYRGGRFIMATDDGLAVSSDDGDSWSLPPSGAGCGSQIQTEGGIAFGNGVIVVLGGDGVSCASSDGGESWDSGSIGGGVDSQLVWTGSEFVAWSQAAVTPAATA